MKKDWKYYLGLSLFFYSFFPLGIVAILPFLGMTLAQAGAFSVVLEGIPADIGEKITQSLRIPTIGIGAGPNCDGQVLVINDMLGLTSGYVPSFVKAYANIKDIVSNATIEWCEEVRDGTFPDDAHSFD